MKQKIQNIHMKLHKISLLHKKPLYVVLTIVFSLLLLADIGMAKLIPDTGNMGSFQSTENMQMPDGADSFRDTDGDSDDADAGSESDDSDSSEDASGSSSDSSEFDMQGMPGNADGNAPSDMDFSNMEDGEMPDFGNEEGSTDSDRGSDAGEDSSSDEETGEFPEQGDFTNTQSENAMGVIGFLQKLRSHWLLLLIILAILDAGSIFMLIRFSRQEKKRREAEEKALREEAAKTGDIHIVRPVKKGSKHSHYLWIIAVIVIVLLIVMVKIFTGQTSSDEAETEATVYSDTAGLSDISTVLPGTGTLEEEDAVALSLPDEVEVTKWYVSDGDTVEEGDVLASVDQVSVMTAIATVQSAMTSLDEALEECEDDAVSDTITAAADARVIAIYAESGTSVADTMYESEALMLLSLDGYMAVSIDTSADISAGDSVNVTLSDGTVVSGKVESMANTAAVVIISDEGPDLGDVVSVETEDGTYVGEGTLYIHSELKVTGFTGTVSSISVSEGSEVSSGATLLTLTDTDYTGQYELLLEQRSVLEEQMETLFQLYEDGYIYASESGVISGLDSSGGDTSSDSDEDSADDTSSDSEDASTDSRSETSADSTADSSSDDSADAASQTSGASGYMVQGLSGNTSSNAAFGSAELSGSNVRNLSSGSDTSVSAVRLTTASGQSVQAATVLSAASDSSENTDADEKTVWIGVVSNITSEEISLTSLTGSDSQTLSLETETEVIFYKDGSLESGAVSDVAAGDILILSYGSDSTLSQIVCISMSASSDSSDNADSSSADQSGTTGSGSEQAGTSGSSEQSSSDEMTGSKNSSESQNGSTDVSGSVSDMSGYDTQDVSGSGASDDYSSYMSASADTTDTTAAEEAATEALEEEISSTYSVSETVWLSITPQDEMTITITVDEMDILSVEVGQEAAVTLDAFPGQSFTGEVTSTDESGTNSGGSSKYTAEVTISREEGMLAGMNASAVITLDTSEDVLSIPETALVEQDGAVYVYTTYDESSDTLGGLTEVTTGISDGENVEILSGLEEGDEYYYSCLDIVNYSSASSSSGSSGSSGSSLFDSLLGGSGMGGGR